jgi:hypothetical protein
MNYYSRFNDSDLEWLVVNNESNFKLGTDDFVQNDTVIVTIAQATQEFIRSVWFLAPFSMDVTNISGIIMDDDFSNRVDMHYVGVWVMSGFGANGELEGTSGAEEGVGLLTLKYVTKDYYSPTALFANNHAMGFSDANPSISLAKGDAVWAGHLNRHVDGTDDMTLTMTLCGEKAFVPL